MLCHTVNTDYSGTYFVDQSTDLLLSTAGHLRVLPLPSKVITTWVDPFSQSWFRTRDRPRLCFLNMAVEGWNLTKSGRARPCTYNV